MNQWKPMAAIAAGSGMLALLLGSHVLKSEVGNSPSSQSADSAPEKTVVSRDVSPWRVETITVPAGTKIHIRLVDAISTEHNSMGDNFAATLDQPLMAETKVVAPSGSTIIGQLTRVEESGRVQGRASLTMTLRKMVVADKEYELKTQPLRLVAQSTQKKDATVIGGGAALGAAIGAIAGGGKGAVIGAGVGGGSGTGYVLATKGEPVAYGPETRFTFKLGDALELPIYQQPS